MEDELFGGQDRRGRSPVLEHRQEASRLRVALQGLPAGKVSTVTTERDHAQQDVGRLRQLIDTAQREQVEIEDRLRRAEHQLRSGNQSVEPHLARTMDLVDGLRDAFRRCERVVPRIRRSLLRMVDLQTDRVLFSHGGEVSDPGARLRELLEASS